MVRGWFGFVSGSYGIIIATPQETTLESVSLINLCHRHNSSYTCNNRRLYSPSIHRIYYTDSNPPLLATPCRLCLHNGTLDQPSQFSCLLYESGGTTHTLIDLMYFTQES